MPKLDGAGAVAPSTSRSPLPESPARRGLSTSRPASPGPETFSIIKSTWGAFFRTDLDAELRKRGIRTIVLGGLATHIGVDTTARQAWELGYEIVIARDVTTSLAVEPHDAAMRYIFPRIARITDSDAPRRLAP